MIYFIIKTKLKNQKEKNAMTPHICSVIGERGQRGAQRKATCKHRSKKTAGPYGEWD